MDSIVEFIGNNYVWFLTFSIILLFALIGYIYDAKRNKNDLVKKSEEELEEISMEQLSAMENKSLNDVVSKSKNINPETKAVELNDAEILQNQPSNVTNTSNNNLTQ